jgi:hypothetical protein
MDRKEDCFEELALTDKLEGRVRVTLEYIGEGYNGDYNPEDSEDEPLIRFTVDKREPGADYWEAVDDASYCTQLSIFLPRQQLESIARSILAEVTDPVLSGYSIKKLCERLSWIEV